MFGNPNNLFTNEHSSSIRRDSTQVLMGEIVDTTGDGGFLDNLSQHYSVFVHGWGLTIPNCKVLSSYAGFNGSGTYQPFKKGDVVYGMAKDGCLEDFLIIGSARLNGKYSDFLQEGQGLKPGELVGTSSAKRAPSNQVSIHPARATKYDSTFDITAGDNIMSPYDNPLFHGDIDKRFQSYGIPGIIDMRGAGGDKLSYTYGSNVIYAGGNMVVASSGAAESKCTRMLDTARRHTRQSGFLLGKNPDNKTQQSSTEGSSTVTLTRPDGTLITSSVADIQVTYDIEEDSSGQVEGEVGGEGPLEAIVNLASNTFNALFHSKKHPADASYRSDRFADLVEKLTANAQNCNQQSGALNQQAGAMQNQHGDSLGNSAAPGTPAPGFKPGQVTNPVNPANQGDRATGNTQNDRIFAAAIASKGADSSAGLNRGKWACVWAVNNVLAAAGLGNPWNNALAVDAARTALKGGKGTQQTSSSAIPGGIVTCGSGSNAHIGIYLGNGRVMSNSSSKHCWCWESDLSMGGGYGSCDIWRIN